MRKYVKRIVWLSCFSLFAIFSNTAFSTGINNTDKPAEHNTLPATVQALIKASYKQKAGIIDSIAAIEDDHKLVILQSLLDNQLYYQKKNNVDKDNKRLLLVDLSLLKKEKSNAMLDAFSGEEVTGLSKRKVKKIGVNNALRRNIRSHLSLIQISHSDNEIRLAAAQNLLKDSSNIDLTFIEEALKGEKNAKVIDVLKTVRALMLLQSDQATIRLLALAELDGSLYPETRIELNKFISAIDAASSPEGSSTQLKNSRADELKLAQKTLTDIETLMSYNGYAENLYFGLALGAVLLLAAIGLAITFGVMGVINMAHGEMIMLGAYTTYVVQMLMPESIGASLLVSIPAAFLVSGFVGILIERSVIRHLYGRPLETLLATFGISLILQQAVRSIFGPLNREVITPDWLAGTFMVNPGLYLTYNRLYIIIFSLVVLAVLALVLKRTLFGLQMRAVTMNRPMASSMGIRTGWVDALTFGLGSGIAGIAGVALSQLTNVGPNLGQAYIIDSFMVVVFGGVGNLWGTLVGAMSLGIANKFMEPVAGAVLAKILVLVFIILFIQKRPRGLFALKGRAVDNG
ncbi:urea ABC transporter permease subunit UrtB [Oleispira antarctica]|uniref:Urea ABC transporter permease subunit UrtB n=1 Tax=Oleispira antarctica TaxID=188908 RepID=A0A1Y5HSY7_OLEAN|nr:urea ABC transporter permease subunit UrtB [Oleispira antarctica]